MNDLVKLALDEFKHDPHYNIVQDLCDEIERLRELCQHHGKNCNEMILRAEKNLLDDMRGWARSNINENCTDIDGIDANRYWKSIVRAVYAYEEERAFQK